MAYLAMSSINLGHITPDTRAFLIGQPMSFIAGTVHNINQIIVFIPRLIRLIMTEGKQLAQHSNSCGMRTYYIPKHADFPSVGHIVQIRRIRQIIAIKMHMIPIGRLTQNKYHILDFTIIAGKRNIRIQLGRQLPIGLNILKSCLRGQHQPLHREHGIPQHINMETEKHHCID